MQQAACAAGREPAQRLAEHQDQHQSQPEAGNRKHDISEIFKEIIERAALINSADSTEGNTAETGEQQCENSQFYCGRQPLRDLGGNVAACNIAGTQIALQSALQPGSVTQPKRSVQTQLRPHRCYLLFGRCI